MVSEYSISNGEASKKYGLLIGRGQMRIMEDSAGRLILRSGIRESLFGLFKTMAVIDPTMSEVRIENKLFFRWVSTRRVPFPKVEVGIYGRTGGLGSITVYQNITNWRVYLRASGLTFIVDQSPWQQGMERLAEQIGRLIGKEVIEGAPWAQKQRPPVSESTNRSPR